MSKVSFRIKQQPYYDGEKVSHIFSIEASNGHTDFDADDFGDDDVFFKAWLIYWCYSDD